MIIDTNDGDTYGDPNNNIWGDNTTNDISAEQAAVDADIDQAAQALANDPGMIAAQNQMLSDVMALFPATNVVLDDSDDCR